MSNEPDVPACNIYLIGRRPRITVDPRTWKCDAESLEVSLTADLGAGESNTVHLRGVNPFGQPLRLVAKAPFTVMELHNEDGDLVSGAPTAMWFAKYLQSVMGSRRMDATAVDEALFDLDVVYVGQSQDAGGAIRSRLQNHGTLQKIMADTNQNAPHLDVWVVLMQFETLNKMAIFGPWTGSQGDKKSLEHAAAVHSAELDPSVITALSEAALILYFQPEFNDKFKDHFPEPLHKTYREVYDLDMNSVGIEFETLATIGIRLKSRVVEPVFIHTGLFALHDQAARRRFFDLDGWTSVADATYLKRGPSSNIPD
ncbi:beta/alpha barrel domain-containing protein [Aeromicrobium choanae]|uniref:hypothetical protein n=1 Tax=Aeromicrobium choanae TaxID=1736691 RepID=UPI0012946FB8|nr:hypothetical protein [Aeromicrobium choanae]